MIALYICISDKFKTFQKNLILEEFGISTSIKHQQQHFWNYKLRKKKLLPKLYFEKQLFSHSLKSAKELGDFSNSRRNSFTKHLQWLLTAQTFDHLSSHSNQP